MVASKEPKKVRVCLYSRVSVASESVSNQTVPLQRYCREQGYEVVASFSEVVHGDRKKRIELERAMSLLRAKKADLLVVWSLDRFARSLHDLIHRVKQINDGGQGVVFIRENLRMIPGNEDPLSSLTMHLVGAISQFELALIRDRTRSALKRLKDQGVKLGRKPKVTAAMELEIVRLWHDGVSIRQIARQIRPQISRASVQSVIKRHRKGGSNA